MLSMHLSKVSLWKEKLFAQKPKRTQACSSNAALYLLLAVLQLLVHERLLLLLPGVPPLRHGFLLLQSSVSKCSVQTSFTPIDQWASAKILFARVDSDGLALYLSYHKCSACCTNNIWFASGCVQLRTSTIQLYMT